MTGQTGAPTPTYRRLVFLVLCSTVPLGVAILLLQILAPLGPPLSDADLGLLRGAISPEQVVSRSISYTTISLVHVFVCLAALAFAVLVLRNAPSARIFVRTGLLMGAAVAILLPIIALIGGRSIVAINLTYFAAADLLEATGAVMPLVSWLPFSPIHLWIYVPTVLGIFSVAMMAAAAGAQLSLIEAGKADESPEAKEALLCLIYGHIKQCAYMLSLVLVTSTVAASIYFHLPIKALDMANKAIGAPRGRLDTFASELSLFWGAVFTLTLIAAIGIPLLLVQRQFRAFLKSLKPPEHAQATRDRLAKGGYLSDGREHTKLLFSFIAPLASGPAASALQGLIG